MNKHNWNNLSESTKRALGESIGPNQSPVDAQPGDLEYQPGGDPYPFPTSTPTHRPDGSRIDPPMPPPAQKPDYMSPEDYELWWDNYEKEVEEYDEWQQKYGQPMWDQEGWHYGGVVSEQNVPTVFNASGGSFRPAPYGGAGGLEYDGPHPTEELPSHEEDWDEWNGQQAHETWRKLQQYCQSNPGGCMQALDDWLRVWETFCNAGNCEPWWSDMLGFDPAQHGWDDDTWAGMPGIGGM